MSYGFALLCSKDWRSKNLFAKRNSSPVATVYPLVQDKEASRIKPKDISSQQTSTSNTARNPKPKPKQTKVFSNLLDSTQ